MLSRRIRRLTYEVHSPSAYDEVHKVLVSRSECHVPLQGPEGHVDLARHAGCVSEVPVLSVGGVHLHEDRLRERDMREGNIRGRLAGGIHLLLAM